MKKTFDPFSLLLSILALLMIAGAIPVTGVSVGLFFLLSQCELKFEW